jgi:hypothetical protein
MTVVSKVDVTRSKWLTLSHAWSLAMLMNSWALPGAWLNSHLLMGRMSISYTGG